MRGAGERHRPLRPLRRALVADGPDDAAKTAGSAHLRGPEAHEEPRGASIFRHFPRFSSIFLHFSCIFIDFCAFSMHFSCVFNDLPRPQGGFTMRFVAFSSAFRMSHQERGAGHQRLSGLPLRSGAQGFGTALQQRPRGPRRAVSPWFQWRFGLFKSC